MNLDDMIPESMKNPAEQDFSWSSFQEKIFDETKNNTTNLSIEAVAGSGKSTTIIQAMKYCIGSTLFLAFNKSIATELQAKIPPGATSKTFNALGHNLLTTHLRNQGISAALNGYRMWDLVRGAMSDDAWQEYGRAVVKLIQLGKHKALGIVDEIDLSQFYEYIGDYSIEIEAHYEDKACFLAAKLFQLSLTITDEFDYDDQVYMPVYWEKTFPQYSTVFVDEAQDLSPIQHIMLQRLAARGARIIAVGDSRQAIYGFRGADSKSMSRMAKMFDMKLLPLSICYRCPKEVVKRAQLIVPHIKYDEDKIDGEVIELKEYPEIKEYEVDSMILCRLNAPLFELALDFVKADIPCQLKSNFGQELIKFVKGFEAKTTDQLHDQLRAWKDKEVLAAEARGFHGKAAIIQDKYASLIPFCNELEYKVEVVAALQRLLTAGIGPTLSTIHKAKGLEADYVYILRPDLLPHPRAKTQSQMEQELNLKYVAITRALKTLTFLPEEL